MAKRIRKTPSPLERKARKGFRGYPAATIAYYGPDDRRATKVAVGIFLQESEDPDIMQRRFSEEGDIRQDRPIHYEILRLIQQHHVKSVVMADRILGCPHEEGVDYPEGESCPKCPFWAGRDRFTGERIH
ncbi:MAG: hypothetical protein P8Z30_13245 [Acidobacteriota bacterium]